MNPRIKVLMRLTKDQLIYKAKEYGLFATDHSKLRLASDIAEFEEAATCSHYNIIEGKLGHSLANVKG